MNYTKEKQEAIEAGQEALYSLKEAHSYISSAKCFGIWDILGGKSFVSLFKHFQIHKARTALDNAKYKLQAFSHELHDIQLDLDINIGEFLTIFDLADNLIADFLIQSRLSDAVKKIDKAIYEVENCISYLKHI